MTAWRLVSQCDRKVPYMDRGLKNWMLASVAIVLAEIGRVMGAQFRLHELEHAIYALAAVVAVIMVIRFLAQKWKND